MQSPKLRQDPEHVDATYPEIISYSFSPTKLLYSLKSNSALHVEECIPYMFELSSEDIKLRLSSKTQETPTLNEMQIALY